MFVYVFNRIDDSKYIDVSGEVDNTKVGTYRIEYKSNLFGIDIKQYRYVEVVDKESPVIELSGSSEVVLCPKETYKEAGYTAVQTVRPIQAARLPRAVSLPARWSKARAAPA